MKSIYKDYDPEALQASYVMVGIEYVAASPTNPRKSFPEAEMAELIESIKQHGVLQPILVRHWPLAYPSPGPLVTYEIVAGERRWRAAQAAGLRMLEAKYRELTDLEVLEIQIIENLQRADLHPLEEAEGYERIMDTHAYTAEQLGAKIGKSRSYIFARLKLLALDDDARRLFRAGLLNPSTALLVARIPTAGLRAKAIKEITETDYRNEIMSVRAAQRHIQSRYMLKLADAPFPTDDEWLHPLVTSCTNCCHRTGNCPDLFEDIESPDVCTDPDCFAAKKIAHKNREAEKATAAGVKVIVGEEAKKIANTDCSIEHTTLKGFTQLNSHCYEDPERRTYAEILGKDVEHALLEDTFRQVMVPVIPNDVLAQKLQAAGVKMRDVENAKSKAKVEAKLVIERATRERLVEIIREQTLEMVNQDAALPYEEMNHILSMVTQRLWERLWQDTGFKIANQWGAEGKNNTERAKSFGLSIPALSTGDCWRLLVDMLIGGSATVNSEYDLEHGGGVLMTMAETVFGIDPDQTRKAVAAQLKADEAAKVQPKTAKSKKKTPAKTAEITPPDTLAEAPNPSEAARAADLNRENAAQAVETSAEEKSETPSAGADLIETEEKPAAPESPSADLIQVGTCVKVKSTCKNWRMAGQIAQISLIVRPGIYKAKYGPNICDVAALVDAEIVAKIPAHDVAQIPAWANETLSSATAETDEAPASVQAFKPDDVVRVLPDANRDGEPLPNRGLVGAIDLICAAGGISVVFAGGADYTYLPGDLEAMPAEDRCDKTADMFQEASA